MIASEFQEMCKRWQSAMRLADWHVEFELADPKDIKGNDGMSHISVINCEAKIQIADPRKVGMENRTFPYSAELTLVHELLHLYFEPVCAKRKAADRRLMIEQAIETLAKAIINLSKSRKGQFKFQ
jgi:hypothetical protein